MFGLIIMVEPNFPQGLQNLAASVIHPVRFSHKGDHHVSFSGLFEQYLGMAGGNYLVVIFPGHIDQQLVNLPLAEDFQNGKIVI